jgi:hypothetical protein
MHSTIRDIKHRARRVIDDPEAPDAAAKPHWGVHEQALSTKGETTTDRLPELMLRIARPQDVYSCRVIMASRWIKPALPKLVSSPGSRRSISATSRVAPACPRGCR